MKIPYLAHIPFVLLFLMFVVVLVATHWTTKRR
jgi:hypothetical protein